MRLPGTKKRFILRYSGRILCGVDLDALRIVRADGEDGAQVTLSIPPSRILDIVTDIRSIRVFHQEQGIFVSPVTLKEQNEEIARDLDFIERNAAHSWEMLERADSNAVRLLESVAACMGFRAKVLMDPRASPDALPEAEVPLGDVRERGALEGSVLVNSRT
jgi:hypothetical protein